jgi:hypothetical protein
MLKLFPIAGTILLTVIILYGVYRIIRSEKQKVADALAGRHYLSRCCHASTTPYGWTQDGWVSTCDACGEWQYLGDNYLNPPPGFRYDGYPNAAPAPRPAASEPESRPSLSRDSGSSLEVTSDRLTPWPPRYTYESNPGDRTSGLWEDGDDGEPLPAAMARQPNIGGEGNPAYQGPHYDVPHDRFVPYEVLGEPIPGTAVHLVGSVAVVGPLPEIDGDNNIREWKPDDEA